MGTESPCGMFHFQPEIMIVAEDIRNAVFTLGEERKGAAFGIDDVARRLSPSHWQDLIDQVRLVVDALIREGKLRRGSSNKPGRFYFASSANVRK